jgi:hypothetical protein
MKLIETILNEICQSLFISSILFIIYILFNLLIKTYGRFKLNKETTFVLDKNEKIILWISIVIFFTYIL